MSNIEKSFGSGGANLTPGGASKKPSAADALRDIADDLETLRAAHNALLAKLDADSGVGDTNYAATQTVASNGIKTKKV